MNFKWSAPIILALLFLSVAAASDFSMDIKTVNNKIQKDQQAVFNLTVKNNEMREITFRIIPPSDPRWNTQTIPVSDRLSGWIIPGQSTRTTTLVIKPTSDITGRNVLTIGVEPKGEGESRKEKQILIDVGSNQPPSEYLPALRVRVEMDKSIDPRVENRLNIIIENQNQVDLTAVKLSVSSDLVKAEEITSVGPKGTDSGIKTIVIPITLNPLQEPRSDTISVDVQVTENKKNYVFEAVPFTFSVAEYAEITSEEKVEKDLLKVIHSITYTNVGNVQKKRMMRLETTWFSRFFTAALPEAEMLSDDNRWYLAWQISLDPQATTTVVATENYWPIVYLMIILVIILCGFLYLRSPIKIKKQTTKIETKEGGLSDIKIVIHLKNVSPKDVHNVSIVDVVPRVAELVREFNVGLHPTRILKHERGGTIIRWDIPKFERFEERILQYRIKTKLSILGQLTLRPTIAKFMVKGRERRCSSKPLRVNS